MGCVYWGGSQVNNHGLSVGTESSSMPVPPDMTPMWHSSHWKPMGEKMAESTGPRNITRCLEDGQQRSEGQLTQQNKGSVKGSASRSRGKGTCPKWSYGSLGTPPPKAEEWEPGGWVMGLSQGHRTDMSDPNLPCGNGGSSSKEMDPDTWTTWG